MASFADVMKKIAANSVKAAGNAVNRSVGASRTQEKPNQPGYDPDLAAAQAASGYVPPQLAQMQPMQNAEEEQQDETENSKLRSAFGNVAKNIVEGAKGQENTLSEDELRAMQSPVDQYAPPSRSDFSTDEEYREAMYNWAEPTITASSALMPGAAMPTENLTTGSAEALGQLAKSQAQRYADAITTEEDRKQREDRAAKQKESIEAAKADPASAARQLGDSELANWIDTGMLDSDPKKQSDLSKRYSQLLSDIESGKTSVTKSTTEKSGRGSQSTVLSDFYDYLQTPEGKEWADLYSDLGYTDEETGLANLLASGDTEAFMQLLGGSDGWNGSERLRARYNNSIPDFYDWRSGEFNDNARDMLADYLWGDQAISPLGLAEGTDYLSRTLSPEDAALLAQWSNYLADNAGFGNPMNNYNLDARDAALFLYATAMTGDNPLNFDQDVTNHMLERAGITQRVGQVGDDSKAALPTLDARKYAIPDLLADTNAENALNPILDNKNTGYYDRALLASIVAAANANNNGKYGIYDI